MKHENLEPAIKIANRIISIKEHLGNLKKANRITTFEVEVPRSDGYGSYNRDISTRFLDFEVVRTLTIANMEKELAELEKQFAELD